MRGTLTFFRVYRVKGLHMDCQKAQWVASAAALSLDALPQQAQKVPGNSALESRRCVRCQRNDMLSTSIRGSPDGSAKCDLMPSSC